MNHFIPGSRRDNTVAKLNKNMKKRVFNKSLFVLFRINRNSVKALVYNKILVLNCSNTVILIS